MNCVILQHELVAHPAVRERSFGGEAKIQNEMEVLEAQNIHKS